jgi:hypothetical protein
MSWTYNSEIITAILEEDGFDVTETETINGMKDESGLNHQVYINPKGHIRYQYATQTGYVEQNIMLGGKQFKYDRETRNVVNIIGYLDDTNSLVSFLRDINKIIKKGR